ncbi:MAG: Type 1 glutamine amidotransferase-like domain-containing protein [Actinomycetia bacterium]|nr:Type 1 glutamine amidotransferase-like domain-containing protein [Actinomycetes bacterium]
MTAGTVAADVAPEGPVATVTAGWRDREKHDSELDQALGGRSQNLHLFSRLGHVIRHDRDFAAAASAFNRAVDEASALYRVRLQHALDAVYATLRRSARVDLVDSALRAGMQSVRDVDSWFLWVLAELEGEMRADGGVDSSDLVAAHRGEVHEMLGRAALVAIAGGHVSFLIRCLRLFEVAPAPEQPVIGWSAGAMVLTGRIVLYHDNGPDGVRPSEIWDVGLGRAPRVIAMPHARRRLQLDSLDRNRVLAHRFAPARVVLLDDGATVELSPPSQSPAEGQRPDGLPGDARVLSPDGQIRTLDEEALSGSAEHDGGQG